MERVAETKRGSKSKGRRDIWEKQIFKLKASLSPCSHSLLGSQYETTKPGLALSYFKRTFHSLCPGQNVPSKDGNCL